MLTEPSAENASTLLVINYCCSETSRMEYPPYSNQILAMAQTSFDDIVHGGAKLAGDRESEDDWDLRKPVAIMFIFHGS